MKCTFLEDLSFLLTKCENSIIMTVVFTRVNRLNLFKKEYFSQYIVKISYKASNENHGGKTQMIITVGREFGSGGREVGKRLADALSIPCYDREIIIEVAKLNGISPDKVERISETDIRRVYAGTIGRTICAPVYYDRTAFDVMKSQKETIRKLAAEGDCVIVGHNADILLLDMNPLNIFVYADKESKLNRCMRRAKNGESEKILKRYMKKVDRERAANRSMISNSVWGKRENYHLCINTSGTEIKSLIPGLAEYVKSWFNKG